jgi:hypothetical protein
MRATTIIVQCISSIQYYIWTLGAVCGSWNSLPTESNETTYNNYNNEKVNTHEGKH